MKHYLLLLIIISNHPSFSQQLPKDYPGNVVHDFYRLELRLIEATPGFTPPVASRALGYTGMALYEAVAPGLSNYRSLESKLTGYVSTANPVNGYHYHWPTVAANAMAVVVEGIFFNCTPAWDDSMSNLLTYYDALHLAEAGQAVFDSSRALGIAIGQDVYQFSKTDGGDSCQLKNFPTGYVPPTGPGMWVPVASQISLHPYWGNIRPFVEADTAMAIMPGPHPAYSEAPGSNFHNHAMQVYQAGLNLTQQERNIADFWGDGAGTITPPGHSINMARIALAGQNANLEESALAYAPLGMGLMDAFISCWKIKFAYNLLRPITYIRNHIDSTWTPYIATPPFPEYVSGHSTQSGTFYIIMTDALGENFSFTDDTHGSNWGGPRTFNSFEDAAREAAISRLYGGIHFEFGNEAGLELGERVGHNVLDLFKSLEINVHVAPIATASPLEVNIFPNPAAWRLSISSTDEMENGVMVYDMNGKYTAMEKSPSGDIDVSNLLPGIYLLKVTAKKTQETTLMRFAKM